MKKSLLIFALKCSVILYFAACTGINEYASNVSATPHITIGTWKVKLFTDAQKNQTTDFEGDTLKFESSGKTLASNNGENFTGYWAEDDISKRMTINIETKNTVLIKLNDNWSISKITSTGLSFENIENPSSGRLQITSL